MILDFIERSWTRLFLRLSAYTLFCNTDLQNTVIYAKLNCVCLFAVFCPLRHDCEPTLASSKTASISSLPRSLTERKQDAPCASANRLTDTRLALTRRMDAWPLVGRLFLMLAIISFLSLNLLLVAKNNNTQRQLHSKATWAERLMGHQRGRRPPATSDNSRDVALEQVDTTDCCTKTASCGLSGRREQEGWNLHA